VRCEGCGSERITYERDALLMASVVRLDGETLILATAPKPARLDEVQICCFDCGRQQRAVDWDDERLEHAPISGMAIDAETALDRIAARVNEPGECQGADFVEFVCQLLPQAGRQVVDSDV